MFSSHGRPRHEFTGAACGMMFGRPVYRSARCAGRCPRAENFRLTWRSSPIFHYYRPNRLTGHSCDLVCWIMAYIVKLSVGQQAYARSVFSATQCTQRRFSRMMPSVSSISRPFNAASVRAKLLGSSSLKAPLNLFEAIMGASSLIWTALC